MSTTGASTPRPAHAEQAAALLGAVRAWHNQRPALEVVRVEYVITGAGMAALAKDPSTDIPRDPRPRRRKRAAA